MRLLRGSCLLALCWLAAGSGCRLAAVGDGVAATSPLEAAAVPVGGERLRPLGDTDAIQLAGTTDDRLAHAGLAYNAFDGQYLAVWEETRSGSPRVYARRLGSTLAPLYPRGSGRSEFALAPASTGVQQAPVVAFDGQRYVAAWQGPQGLEGVALGRDGVRQGAGFALGGPGATQGALSATGTDGLLMAAWVEQGRVRLAAIGTEGPRPAVAVAEPAGGLLGNWFSAPQKAPMVVSSGTRALVAWQENGTYRARLVGQDGTLGAMLALGEVRDLALAARPDGGYVAAYEQQGRVMARGLETDGTAGAPTNLGEGVAPAVLWNPQAQSPEVYWRSNGYVVRQKLDSRLSLAGAASLLPSAGARSVTVSYNAGRKETVLALEEHISSFDRLSLVRVR